MRTFNMCFLADKERSNARDASFRRICEHALYPILKDQSYRRVFEAVHRFSEIDQIDERHTVEKMLSSAPLALLKDFEEILQILQTPNEVLDSLHEWMHENGQGEAYDAWCEVAGVGHPERPIRDYISAWAFQNLKYLQIYLSYWNESFQQDGVSAAHRYLITKCFPHITDAPIIYDMPNGAPRLGDWVEDEHMAYLRQELGQP